MPCSFIGYGRVESFRIKFLNQSSNQMVVTPSKGWCYCCYGFVVVVGEVVDERGLSFVYVDDEEDEA